MRIDDQIRNDRESAAKGARFLDELRQEIVNSAEILTGDKNGSQGSRGALIGLEGSQHESQETICDPYLGESDHTETNGDAEFWEDEINSDGSEPPPKNTGKAYKPKSEEEEKEQESKLAAEVADVLVDKLCYDETGGDWYSQTGGLWRVVSEKEALKIIMQVLDVRKPDGYAMAKLNNVKSFLMIYLLMGKWASNRHLLPMKNGVLDTKTMELSDYSHKHRFNWQLPYSFNPNAKINVIRSWLWSASGQDMESVNIIRAFFKMALVGGDVQKFLELIGSGGTGKSTLIRLLVEFIGKENHAATDLKNLEQNKFEAAALYGKRLVLISDSSRYGGEVSTLKALTGGDPIRIEKKNIQQSGSFIYSGVVVIASNEAIQTADYTSGLIRRRMPVNFNQKVTDADKQKWAAAGGIEAAMHNELPGLLNWVMQMTEAEVKAAIGGINGQMTQTQREHLIDTNKIAGWLDDNIVIEPCSVVYVGASTAKKDITEAGQMRRKTLYANYEEWCSDVAVHPVGLSRFTANIIDVCNQLKIDVTALDKDRNGKPIKGIAIRCYQHLTYETPVTKKIIRDPKTNNCDASVTPTTSASDGRDPCDPKNLSVINTSFIDEDAEVF